MCARVCRAAKGVDVREERIQSLPPFTSGNLSGGRSQHEKERERPRTAAIRRFNFRREVRGNDGLLRSSPLLRRGTNIPAVFGNFLKPGTVAGAADVDAKRPVYTGNGSAKSNPLNLLSVVNSLRGESLYG